MLLLLLHVTWLCYSPLNGWSLNHRIIRAMHWKAKLSYSWLLVKCLICHSLHGEICANIKDYLAVLYAEEVQAAEGMWQLWQHFSQTLLSLLLDSETLCLSSLTKTRWKLFHFTGKDSVPPPALTSISLENAELQPFILSEHSIRG